MKRLLAAVTLFLMLAVLLGGMVQTTTAQDNQYTIYVVQPQDTLTRIGAKFNISPYTIAQINFIVNPNYILVGQKLKIPTTGGVSTLAATTSGTSAATSAPSEATGAATMVATSASTEVATAATSAATTVATSAATAAPTSIPGGQATTYTVQPGDNLFRISIKSGTSWIVLEQLNGLFNPNLIYVGQVLRLPAGTNAGSTPTSTPVPGTTPSGPVTPVPSTASNVGFAYGLDVELTGQDAATVTSKVTDLGTTWVKQRVYWKNYEPTKGAIDFTALDAQVSALAASKAKILFTVSRAPDWARSSNQEDGPATDNNDFVNFVSKLADHFKGKVQAYEIWEKPNVRREWNGKALSSASYVELLRLSYNAIKSVDSAALVISAGLASTGFDDGVNAINDRVFLKQAFANGLATYADAIGAQPFGWANPPDSSCCLASPGVTDWYKDRSFYFKDTLSDYRDVIVQANAASKFIWITDFGWASLEAIGTGATVNDSLYGYIKFTSQNQQAQYNVRGFEIGKALGYIGPMFVSNLNACQVLSGKTTSNDYAMCYYSLLDKDGNPRPAYTALKSAVPH